VIVDLGRGCGRGGIGGQGDAYPRSNRQKCGDRGWIDRTIELEKPDNSPRKTGQSIRTLWTVSTPISRIYSKDGTAARIGRRGRLWLAPLPAGTTTFRWTRLQAYGGDGRRAGQPVKDDPCGAAAARRAKRVLDRLTLASPYRSTMGLKEYYCPNAGRCRNK